MKMTEVHITHRAKLQLQDYLNEKPALETGGLLIGREYLNGRLEIRFISGPGPNAKHSPMTFQTNSDYCQGFLDAVFEMSDGHEWFLGEWHSHPSGILKASSNDVRLCSLHAQKSRAPLMLITHLAPNGDLSAAAYVYRDATGVVSVPFVIPDLVPDPCKVEVALKAF